MPTVALLDRVHFLRELDASDPCPNDHEHDAISSKDTPEPAILSPDTLDIDYVRSPDSTPTRLRSQVGRARSTRPNYHTGLSKEELKGSPKQRLEALLSSSTATSVVATLPTNARLYSTSLSNTCGDAIILESRQDVDTRAPSNITSSSMSPSANSPRATTMHLVMTKTRAEVPREASISSTMSSMSSTISGAIGPQTPIHANDPIDSKDAKECAGDEALRFAEKAIQRLVKDKQVLATRNDQLWKLVETQRNMLLALNKDLDKLVKERERYRRQKKDHHQVIPNIRLPTDSEPSAGPLAQTISAVDSSSLPPRTTSLRRQVGTGQDSRGSSPVTQDTTGLCQPTSAPNPPQSLVPQSPISTPASPNSPGGAKRKAPPTTLDLAHLSQSSGPILRPDDDDAQKQLHDSHGPDHYRGRRRTRDDDDLAADECHSHCTKAPTLAMREEPLSYDSSLECLSRPGVDGQQPNASAIANGLPASPRPPPSSGTQAALRSPKHFPDSTEFQGVPRTVHMRVPYFSDITTVSGLPSSPHPDHRLANGTIARAAWKQDTAVNSISLGSMSPRAGILSPRLPREGVFLSNLSQLLDSKPAKIDTNFQRRGSSAARIETIHSRHSLDEITEDSPDSEAPFQGVDASASTLHRKEGYLAMRVEPADDWKTSCFILDIDELRQYDGPGGPLMRTIPLHKAQIARPHAGESPSHDSEYSYGFVVVEQTHGESPNLFRHVLCAESDHERDAWTLALQMRIDRVSAQSPTRRFLEHDEIYDGSMNLVSQRTRSDSQAVHHEQMSHTASPPTESMNASGPTRPPLETHARGVGISGRPSPVERPAISGPVAGGPIQNASAWGNKPVVPKESRRNIFGFKSRTSDENVVEARPAVLGAEKHAGCAVFGLPLDAAVELSSASRVGICLPTPVYRCLEWLEAHSAADEQGLFRQSGSQTSLLSLKERFNQQGDVDLIRDDTFDCHTIASLLKMYFRELPESVLTRALHLDFMKVLVVRDLAEKLMAINVLAHRLPEANFALLSTVFRYLVEVAANQERNLMGVRNLATIWTAALSVPAPLIDHFITHHDAIFGPLAVQPKSPSIRAIDSESPVSAASSSASDLRSPHKQMFMDLATPTPDKFSYAPTVYSSNVKPLQLYNRANTDPCAALRDLTVAPAMQQRQAFSGDQAYGSLTAALLPTTIAQNSMRNEEPNKLVKKSRRESSIRALGISGPLMLPDQARPMSPLGTQSKDSVPNTMAAEKRKSSLNRLKELAGLGDS